MEYRSIYEDKAHSTAVKPFSYYRSNIPEYFPSVPLHWHKEFELNLILEGRGEFICGEDRFTAAPGDLVVILPNAVHGIMPVNNEPFIYETIVFDGLMLGAHDNDRACESCIRPMINRSVTADPLITGEHIYYSELRMSAENVISAAKGNTPGLDMLMKSELLRLFWLLGTSGTIHAAKRAPGGRSELIRSSLEYISKHFREELTIAGLAEQAHISKSYYMSVFKSVTGIGALEYVSQLRLREARDLLEGSDKTVSEVAYEVGYKNLSNFNRQFRALCGCSPREFRAKKGAEQ